MRRFLGGDREYPTFPLRLFSLRTCCPLSLLPQAQLALPSCSIGRSDEFSMNPSEKGVRVVMLPPKVSRPPRASLYGLLRPSCGRVGGVPFYRITFRRTAKAKSAICKGPSIPSRPTKNWNSPGSSGLGSGFSRTKASKLYTAACQR